MDFGGSSIYRQATTYAGAFIIIKLTKKMYFDESKDNKNLQRKRSFKFVNKNGYAVNRALISKSEAKEEANEVEK